MRLQGPILSDEDLRMPKTQKQSWILDKAFKFIHMYTSYCIVILLQCNSIILQFIMVSKPSFFRCHFHPRTLVSAIIAPSFQHLLFYFSLPLPCSPMPPTLNSIVHGSNLISIPICLVIYWALFVCFNHLVPLSSIYFSTSRSSGYFVCYISK